MTVSVVVPYRADCYFRERALRWVLSCWAERHPEFEVVLGQDGSGAWRKAVAVRDALAKANGDVLVVADADVWSDSVADAVAVVEDGTAWALPHRCVRRLTVHATDLVIDGASPIDAERRRGLIQSAYAGVPGGGMVVLERATYEACPLDERFIGWGGEDEAWGWALSTLFGAPRRMNGMLWHLWHPPAPRLSRVIGSRENDMIRKAYFQARADRERMRSLLAEGQS